MPYTFNQSEASYGELVPAGDYEVQIEKIERKTIPTSGKEKLSVMFRIRSDVEQENKNRVVFDDIWAEREHPEFFNRRRLNQLLGTQEIDDGHVFGTIDDVIGFLQGAFLQIHLVVEFDEYNGKDRNQVKWYMSSKCAPQSISPVQEPGLDITDDDLPF